MSIALQARDDYNFSPSNFQLEKQDAGRAKMPSGRTGKEAGGGGGMLFFLSFPMVILCALGLQETQNRLSREHTVLTASAGLFSVSGAAIKAGKNAKSLFISSIHL